jgi:DnaJ-domain-containing protein 1
MPLAFRTRRYFRQIQTRDFSSAWETLAVGVDFQSVLDLAIESAPAAHLKILLLSGAMPSRTALHHPLWVARRSAQDPAEKLSLLVSFGCDVNGFTGTKRIKLINQAILDRDEYFFRFLMNQKVDIHSADRTRLHPLQAAQMLEERAFERRLLAEGASVPEAEKKFSENLIELLIINENPLFSELNTLIKWCVRNSGFENLGCTQPEPQMLRYRIRFQNLDFRIELHTQAQWEITLFLFENDARFPFSGLLPPTAKIDSTQLRGHLVTILTELRKQIESGSFKAEEIHTPPLLLSPRAEKALHTLGLNAAATELEIITAYRKLAKRYHPDKVPDQQEQMTQVNEAYEVLRKKK